LNRAGFPGGRNFFENGAMENIKEKAVTEVRKKT
jgi:hypothetical protein